METVPTDFVIVFGILQPDGTVQLDHPPEMPPGRIQLTIRPLPPQRERLPDLPTDDDSVPPPFDLPRLEITGVVQPIRVLQRLPDSAR